MSMIKQKLLQTGYFIDNNFLDQYIELVHKGSTANYLERHHILPRAYYRLIGKPVDNSKTNLVKLSFADHCMAHWLLYFCTLDKLKYSNQAAFIIMVNGLEKQINKYTQVDFIMLQQLKDQFINECANFWSREEDNFLTTNFLYLTDAELATKLMRSEIAVRARRSYLKLQRFKMTDFTADELKFIKDNYKDLSIKEIASILNRSRGSVSQKIARLNLKKRLDRPWTSEEIELLKSYVTTKSLTEISILLDRTKLAIKAFCHKHRIICKRTDLWSSDELDFITNNMNKLTAREIAIKLNRTIGAVEHKIHIIRKN